MKHKPIFWTVVSTYALAILMLHFAKAPHVAAPMAHAPVETPGVAAWLTLAFMLLAGLALILWLARATTRRFIFHTGRLGFACMLLMGAVCVKVAATKTNVLSSTPWQTMGNGENPAQGGGANSGSAPQGGANNKNPTQPQNPGFPGSPNSTPGGGLRGGTESAPQQRAYAYEAAGLPVTTNFFTGRLYADPHAVLSRNGVDQTLSFTPAQPLSDDTPLGSLLAFYDLPGDIQAVVILASLDGRRAPLGATLLAAPNLVIQQATDDLNDPEITGRVCRLAPVGTGRQLRVNGVQTTLFPRDGWCAITVDADALHPIDLRLATLGNNGHRYGGAYWPGRVAAAVFVPREWQPDPNTPPEPIVFDATLRNALESYLFYKHRYALASPLYAKLPPELQINHVKMALVETLLGLPRVKITGSLFLIR